MKHPYKRPSVRPPGSRGQRRGLRQIHPDAAETPPRFPPKNILPPGWVCVPITGSPAEKSSEPKHERYATGAVKKTCELLFRLGFFQIGRNRSV
jgi:hypothetical protein